MRDDPGRLSAARLLPGRGGGNVSAGIVASRQEVRVSRTSRSYEGLVRGIERCLELAGDRERLARRDDGVSAWDVGQQVEHLARADSGIVKWVLATIDEPGRGQRTGRPSGAGRAVLATGWIPRGRGRAPEGTVPGGLSEADLLGRLEAVRATCEELRPRLRALQRSRRTREHPVLGHFTPAEWLRFLHVHHRHHDKIIRKILA